MQRGFYHGLLGLVGAVLLSACGTEPAAPVPETGTASATAPDPAGGLAPVRLDEMDANRRDPAPERRNPFRFGLPLPAVDEDGVDDAESEPAPVSAPPRPVPAPVAAPGGASSGGGIPLRFIGFVESPGIQGRIVVLTDGDVVFYGRQGDVIDGRYRIVGIGLESVDLERIDGGGAQTVSLPGGPNAGL